MKRKILLAIKEELTRKLYSRVFREDGFEVIESDNIETALALAKKEIPDIILADVFLSPENGFELIKSLKKEAETRDIPVMVFSKVERVEDRRRAMEMEAKDYIIGVLTSPENVVLKTRVHLGEEKTYQIPISENMEGAKELAKDLGYNANLICSSCGSPLHLSLIRDLRKGKNYFKVAFICPKCSQNLNKHGF